METIQHVNDRGIKSNQVDFSLCLCTLNTHIMLRSGIPKNIRTSSNTTILPIWRSQSCKIRCNGIVATILFLSLTSQLDIVSRASNTGHTSNSPQAAHGGECAPANRHNSELRCSYPQPKVLQIRIPNRPSLASLVEW
jgi:hypothetical protein